MVPLQAKKPGVEFVAVVDAELAKFETDRYRLEQILLNFLSNAFKHTESGLVTLAFDVIGASQMRISVTDTGKGIKPEMQEKLFSQFSQSSTRDAAELGGFGLGLYLTKMLAQLLGGQVGFESTLRVGSVFWVDLPLRRDSTSVAIQFEESEFRVGK